VRTGEAARPSDRGEGRILEKLIGECAEKIIAVLEQARAVNILRLSEQLSERSLIVYQAVGWLAREGRVTYEEREKQVYIRLSPERGGGGPSTRPG
jgi:hypothetical protein